MHRSVGQARCVVAVPCWLARPVTNDERFTNDRITNDSLAYTTHHNATRHHPTTDTPDPSHTLWANIQLVFLQLFQARPSRESYQVNRGCAKTCSPLPQLPGEHLCQTSSVGDHTLALHTELEKVARVLLPLSTLKLTPRNHFAAQSPTTYVL